MGPAGIATATLLAVLLTTVIILIRRLQTYWARRNIPTVADNFFHGIHRNTINLTSTIGESYRKAYEANPNLKYYGTYFFGRPTLVIQDPEILKHILVTDFGNFNSHGCFSDTDRDPLSGHLFNLDGQKWKTMRNKLSVTFTSGKIKHMFETVQKCIDSLHSVIADELDKTGKVSDMTDKLACLGTDVIASVAFGIEVNSLKNPKAEFREVGRLVFSPTYTEFMRQMIILNIHWLAKLLNVRATNKRSYDFIMEMVKKTVEYREKNNVVRNDFLNLLIQLKNKGYIESEENESQVSKEAGNLSRITLEQLAAQVYLFYIAGFETTSTLTSFTLYELSIHKDIQRKVQEECDRVLKAHGGKVTYEGIQSMVYTDEVIHETLRFFPPLGALIRVTTKECNLPLTNITLDKNTSIAAPVLGLHMDPQYYPDPEKFDPERFSDKQKDTRPPYVYLPFGEGPRICIGMRFGLVQVKSVLLGLFSRYDFDLTPDTPVPVQVNPKSLVTAPKKLDFVITKRESTFFE